MPISRAHLHESKIDEFAAWAEKHGWERQPTKGEYEVLRLRKVRVPGQKIKKSHRDPIIFHQRLRSDHATIGWNQSVGHGLVRTWLNERKQGERIR